MRQIRKKANVMLLVLFIMFITSLLGLLVSQYVRNMITISRLFTQYYSTYFIAYGGLELGLTQVKYHNFGFEDELTFTGFICQTQDCTFEMEIVSRSQAVADSYSSYTGCADVVTANELYELDAGECFITPLFYDVSQGFDPVSYDDITSTELEFDMDLNIYNQSTTSATGEYVVRIIDEETQNFDVLVEKEIENPMNYDLVESELGPYTGSADNKNFLIIANATGDTKEFCLEVGSGELVRNYVTISSIGSNSSADISFGAIKLYNVDSFNCFGTINPP